MKKCSKCKQTKLLEEFNKHRTKFDGLACYCRVCANRKNRDYYLNHHNKEVLRRRTINRNYRARRLAAGLCRCCTDTKLLHSVRCLYHWVLNVVDQSFRNHKFPKTSTKIQVLNYLVPLAKTITHCPYTGELLTPGVNMSIDHKLPLSRYPHRAFDLDNLEWVSLTYNYAKRDRTTEEFNRHYTIIYTP